MTIVANVSKHDTLSRRFNNYDARLSLLKYGIDSKFICWTKPMGPPDYSQQAKSTWWSQWTPQLAKYGRATGNINGYYRNASAITSLDFYKTADVLHFHIVHDEYLSLRDWRLIGKSKPLVWTWHDPYMFSGHCIYSLDCTRFESGCQTCPHLDYYFPIEKDRSAKNLADRLIAVQKLDPLVIVASEYMQDLLMRSVYKDKVRKRKLHFGIQIPNPIPQIEARAKLHIPKENIVVGFRATSSPFKGMPLILDSLKKFAYKNPGIPLTIITFDHLDCCKDLPGNWQLIEAGWVHGDEINDYYASMDYFLMPSRAEAFGLMAIEALACGATPLVTNGTSLPPLVGAPSIGRSCDHELNDYYEMLESALLTSELNKQGRQDRINYAHDQYRIDKFSSEMAQVYQEEIEYFKSKRI